MINTVLWLVIVRHNEIQYNDSESALSIEVNQVCKQIVDCEVEFRTVGQGNIGKQERNTRIKWY